MYVRLFLVKRSDLIRLRTNGLGCDGRSTAKLCNPFRELIIDDVVSLTLTLSQRGEGIDLSDAERGR